MLARTPPEQLWVSYYQRLTGEFVRAEYPLTPAESHSIGALELVAETLPYTDPVLGETGQQLKVH